MEKLRTLVIQHDIDVMALTELNQRWSKIHDENTIWRAVKRWKEHVRTFTSYNHKDPGSTPTQYGGTSITLFNKHIHSIFATGSDDRGWGRWTWTKLQGKNNRNTLLISAYCPCINPSANSVWSQHILQMSLGNFPDTDNPRSLFLERSRFLPYTLQKQRNQYLTNGRLQL